MGEADIVAAKRLNYAAEGRSVPAYGQTGDGLRRPDRCCEVKREPYVYQLQAHPVYAHRGRRQTDKAMTNELTGGCCVS